MRFGTVCSGIGAPEVAWHELGWRSVFASEIEAFPRAVLRHHWPATALHGDFTTIKGDEYGPVDLLCGGTPCQSFSIAGLRGGLADERGNLALEFLRLADRLRPRWVVWENVPGVLSSAGGRDFGAFLGGLAECGYGWAYRVLDAQHFGLAQRRKRVFVVGYLGDWRPAAAVLFEPASLRGDPAPRREAGERVAPTVARGSPGGRTYGLDADTADSLIAGTLNANGKAAGSATQQDAESGLLLPIVSPALKARDYKGPSSDGDGDGAPLIVAHTLRAEGFDASEDGTGRGVPLVAMPLRAGRQYSDMGDGTANVVPVVAASLTSGKGNGGNPAGRRKEDDTNLVAFGWQNSASQGDSASPHTSPTLDKSKTPAVMLGATAETMYGINHADAQEARPDQALRALREAVGEKAFAEWGVGVVAALRASEVLQSGVHGGSIRCAPDNWKQLGDDALPCAETGSDRAVQRLWRAACDGCSPSGWQPSEQLARQLGAYLSRLSHQGASPARLLLGLWRAGEGLGLLREALSAVQEAWRPAGNQGEPAQPRAAVRRLTPREAERLQGFPDDYTLIPYRKGMAADGPRYRALGNSMAVPVVRWIGERIGLVNAQFAKARHAA